MAATIRDIRNRTGLSLATISKYLNGGNVLPENRKAIAEAIEELHYEVNEVARGLATQKSRTIGVLIQTFDNIFMGSIVSNIERILREHNYGTIVCDCQQDKKLEEEEIHFLLGKRVDGIITIPTAGNAGYLQAAVDRKIPIVLLDRTFTDQKFDSILVDNVEAARGAVQILIDHGHTRIAIICGDDSEYTARERLRGYCTALESANIDIEASYIKRGKLSTAHGYESMKELLAMKDRPSAVFFSNYEITLGGIMAINELHVAFPQEISLIGFDNFMLSKVINPKLWMVNQPMETIAQQAAELMLKRLEESGKKGEDYEPETIILPTDMVEGESIRALS
ncbi:MAG: LacI family transcriptional regulator [Lachnospiraceae bacterium]|nr:LacI family transcriptional regulator [Lachnospiraceae bacterium]